MSITDSTDELIRRAIGNGANLPNSGKRLDLDDPYTPDELKMAHKILKDNDLVPSWITDGKELDALYDALIDRVRRALLAPAIPQTLNADVSAFNKRILSYNLKVPQGLPHKRMIDVERERRRLTGG